MSYKELESLSGGELKRLCGVSLAPRMVISKVLNLYIFLGAADGSVDSATDGEGSTATVGEVSAKDGLEVVGLGASHLCRYTLLAN